MEGVEEVAAEYRRKRANEEFGYLDSLLYPLHTDLYCPGCGAITEITSEWSRIADIHS